MTPLRSPSRRRSESGEGGFAVGPGAAVLDGSYLLPGSTGGSGQEQPLGSAAMRSRLRQRLTPGQVLGRYALAHCG